MVRTVTSSWAHLVGKQDWNHKRECPALKTLMGQVCSMLDLDPGPDSAIWIRGWHRTSVCFLSNTGLGFHFHWMQCGSRAETGLSLVLTESSHDQRMAQTDEVQSTLASLGFRVTSLTLPPPSAFVLCLLPHAEQCRKSVLWDAGSKGQGTRGWWQKEAGGRVQKVPLRWTEVRRLLTKKVSYQREEKKENGRVGIKSQMFRKANKNKAEVWSRKIGIGENKRSPQAEMSK